MSAAQSTMVRSPLGLPKDTIVLQNPNPTWAEEASHTIQQLRNIFGDLAVDIQHIGSTAIPGIKAKPVIDIGIAVHDLAAIKSILPQLTAAGFIHRPRRDTPDYSMFVIGDIDAYFKTHHIHIDPHDSPGWHNRINFRDYLNAFPSKAKEYEALKIELAEKYTNNRSEYLKGKAAFIERMFTEAAEWKKTRRSK